MRLLNWEGTNLKDNTLTIGVPYMKGILVVEDILVSIGVPFRRIWQSKSNQNCVYVTMEPLCKKDFVVNYIVQHPDKDFLVYLNERITKSLSDRIKLEGCFNL